jgi:hypothetical protein
MATTTNYSWSTPDDTALVKDGAAAIRSLGTAIDTTVFNNAGAAIAKTIVDAKGDLIVATAADTVARLASSASNGDLLTVDTSTASGLKWATPAASGGMTLLSTTTLSGTSTTISTINQTYKHLYLVGVGISTSASTEHYLRLNSDTGGNYYNAKSAAEQGSVAGATSTGQTRAPFSVSPSNSNPYQAFFEISIPRYAETQAHMVYYRSHGLYSGTRYSITGSTAYDSTTAISAFTILTDAAQTFSTGTIYTYGVN